MGLYIPQRNMNLKERGLVISVNRDSISASSVGRISHFDRQGDFLSFLKTPSNINSKFLYLGNKLLGFVPRKGQLSVSIYDSRFKRQGELLNCPYWLDFSSNKNENFFDRAADTLLTAVHDGRIFIARGDAQVFGIDVFKVCFNPF